jgi:hypothetical protein
MTGVGAVVSMVMVTVSRMSVLDVLVWWMNMCVGSIASRVRVLYSTRVSVVNIFTCWTGMCVGSKATRM